MKMAAWQSAFGAMMLHLTFGAAALADEKLALASGRSGTPTYTAGVGLSTLIKFELLPTDKIDLQALESPGVIDNVRLLQTGEAELAILPSVVGHAARLGIGTFAGSPPETGFRAIATLWRDALHLLVRKDDVATGTIDDLLALKDRKVFLGDAATGMDDTNRLLLADLGMNADQAFKVAKLADGDGIAAIKRGEVDAFSATARPPEAGFAEVFENAPFDLRLLDVTEAQMIRANGNHWLWTPYVIPAATYPGQNEDVWTIGLSNVLVVRADVDPDVVYTLTRCIFENLNYLNQIDPLMTEFTLETALSGLAMPLHPGALRFFDEAGLIPKPVSGKRTSTPEMTPVKQHDEQPDTVPEHYPDADVAGEWPKAAGGPLLEATPSIDAPLPSDVKSRPEPHWRQRATL